MPYRVCCGTAIPRLLCVWEDTKKEFCAVHRRCDGPIAVICIRVPIKGIFLRVLKELGLVNGGWNGSDTVAIEPKSNNNDAKNNPNRNNPFESVPDLRTD